MALGKNIRNIVVPFVILVVPMFWGGRVEAQSSCASTIGSLSPCMSFNSGNNSNPSTSCCSQLASMAKVLPMCICDVNFVGADVLGLVLNRTLILSLPRACNLDVPALSNCAGLGSQNGPTDGGASSYFDSDGTELKTPVLLAIFLTLGIFSCTI